MRRANELLRETRPELTDEEHEAAKAATNARLEEVFPGLAEDEATESGMYEPSLEHFPSNYRVMREVIDHRYSLPFTPDNPQSIRPSHQSRTEFGTGPVMSERQLRNTRFGNNYRRGDDVGDRPASPEAITRIFEMHANSDNTMNTTLVNANLSDEDADRGTPNFGTGRNERDYGGFWEGMVFSNPHEVDSPEYWQHVDTHHSNIRLERRIGQELSEQMQVADSSENIRTRFGSRTFRGDLRRGLGYAIDSLRPFAAGAHGRTIRGRPLDEHSGFQHPSNAGTYGRMGPEAREHLDTHDREIGLNYVIYSYNTPIAWRTGDGAAATWYVTTEKHSTTTSKHQYQVRRALNRNFGTSAHAIAELELWRQAQHQDSPRIARRFYLPNYAVHAYSPDREIAESAAEGLINSHHREIIQPEREERREISNRLLQNRRARERQARIQRRYSRRNTPELPLEYGNG
jgi:hypothetical protein